MVVGISVVKDEADIIGRTVSHMLAQVDRVIVADNGSTDGTQDILDGLGCEVVDDPEAGHYQGRKMSALAERAREQGATWVVPFDADEIWRARDGRIADVLPGLTNHMVAEAQLFDYVATPDGWDRWRRPLPTPMRKVACRAVGGVQIAEGNHSASFTGVRRPPAALDVFVVSHFPYRSAAQMIRKARKGAAALAATDLPESVGQHWRDYGRLSDAQLTEAFLEHFYSVDPESDGLVLDPCAPRS